MTSERFDTAARMLAGNWPRRRLLAALAGLFGVGLALPDRALACKKVGRTCDKDKECCDGAKCKKGKCRCKGAFSECSKRCFDLDKDESHCGSCNTACSADQTCCSGACVNLQQNKAHCGACDAACPDLIAYACIGGECIPR